MDFGFHQATEGPPEMAPEVAPEVAPESRRSTGDRGLFAFRDELNKHFMDMIRGDRIGARDDLDFSLKVATGKFDECPFREDAVDRFVFGDCVVYLGFLRTIRMVAFRGLSGGFPPV